MTPNQTAALETLVGRQLTQEEVTAIDQAITSLGRDDAAIAEVLSEGRTKPKPVEIGKGTIIEVLDLPAGNAFLDAIEGNADFRHVKHLLTDGRLRVDSAMVSALTAGFVQAGLITTGQRTALLALGLQPDPITERAVTLALNAAQEA